MTITIEEKIIGNYSIEILQEKGEASYHVRACPRIWDYLFGPPVTDNYYPTLEQARKRFTFLKSKAKKGEL